MRRIFFTFAFLTFFCVFAQADGGGNPSQPISLSSPNSNNVTISINGKDETKESAANSWTDTVSSIGTFGSFVVAIIAAIYAYRQYQNSKVENRRAIAYQNYSNFLQMAFNNPQFAIPQDELLKDHTIENLKYKYFVANMLFAFEQIFMTVGKDPDWQTVMKDQIRRHKTHLITSKSIEAGHWDKEFSKFIQSALA